MIGGVLKPLPEGEICMLFEQSAYAPAECGLAEEFKALTDKFVGRRIVQARDLDAIEEEVQALLQYHADARYLRIGLPAGGGHYVVMRGAHPEEWSAADRLHARSPVLRHLDEY